MNQNETKWQLWRGWCIDGKDVEKWKKDGERRHLWRQILLLNAVLITEQ